MNNWRLIRYFALLIVFCAEYRYVSNETWPERVLRFINEARTVEPSEKMKVNIQNLSIEWDGEIVKSYAHESLTLIANEHSVQRKDESSDGNSSKTRVYYQFIITLANSDSTSKTIFRFWSMQIKRFAYFLSTGSKIKLILMPEYHKGVIAVDFLNPGDAQLFWNYASKNRNRTRSRVIDVLRFEIFNRGTKEKVGDTPFAVIHKEWCRNTAMTYTISLESDGVTQKPLLVFSGGRSSASNIIEDRIGLFMSDDPDLVFILQFSPREMEAAVDFHRNAFLRSKPFPMSDDELRGFFD